MKFERGIGRRYQDAIRDAFDAIASLGTGTHREMVETMLDSEMLVRCGPVSQVSASGRTGLINAAITNLQLLRERFSLRDALGEVYIVIAEETIDTGGQRGCEGTFVHEGQHALDFAQTISSLSNRDMNPLDVYDPTLYDLEWSAHRIAGEYMLSVARDEYVQEGLDLMILGRSDEGKYFLNDEGIRTRLRESYGLTLDGDMGPRATQLLGIVV